MTRPPSSAAARPALEVLERRDSCQRLSLPAPSGGMPDRGGVGLPGAAGPRESSPAVVLLDDPQPQQTGQVLQHRSHVSRALLADAFGNPVGGAAPPRLSAS
jgi:hypothetical protein